MYSDRRIKFVILFGKNTLSTTSVYLNKTIKKVNNTIKAILGLSNKVYEFLWTHISPS